MPPRRWNVSASCSPRPEGTSARHAAKLAQRELRAQRAAGGREQRARARGGAGTHRRGLHRAARARARHAQPVSAPASSAADVAALARAVETLETVILGKPAQIRLCLACLLARGHLLIEDVPGVGKTTLAHALAHVLGLAWQRVQFTSDLLPADIIGVSVFDRASAAASTSARGRSSRSCCWPMKSTAPARARRARCSRPWRSARSASTAPPTRCRTRSSSSPRRTRTSSWAPIALPESQLDRFLMRVTLGYPDAAHERALLRGGERRELLAQIPAALSAAAVLRVQRTVRARAHRGRAARLRAGADRAHPRARGPQARALAARRPGADARRAGLGAAAGARRRCCPRTCRRCCRRWWRTASSGATRRRPAMPTSRAR